LDGADAEKLLKVRGVLEPTSVGGKMFETKKEEQEHYMLVNSNYLVENLDNDELETLNKYLEESEKISELILEPKTVNYKDLILQSFKQVNDPYQNQIEDINFDQNPNDPSQLQMNVRFIKQ